MLGIKLRPATFCALSAQPIGELNGQRRPLAELFGAPARDYAEAVGQTDDDHPSEVGLELAVNR